MYYLIPSDKIIRLYLNLVNAQDGQRALERPFPLTQARRSVVDDLRHGLQYEVLRFPFKERIALVLRLGEFGLGMFRQARLPRSRDSDPHVLAGRMNLLEEST
jgi:hypothetical protein